jgi:curved DNA-binding protein CbpA
MAPARDHYDVLGVARTASPTDIRRAYRTLARRYHPDVQPGGDTLRFEELSNAYEVLHDPARRARYDEATAPPTPAPVRRRREDVPRFLDEEAPQPRIMVWRVPAWVVFGPRRLW